MALSQPETLSVGEPTDVEVEDERDDESEASIQEIYSITTYGADFPVDGLVERMRSQHIYVPEFQRGFIWSLPRASRFVESLLLGLPVPSIFLWRDESQKLVVIDGQQRLRTLHGFYEGIFPQSDRGFALKGVRRDLEGRTYASLSEEDRRRLSDSLMHATIVKQDEPTDDNSSIYHIFERLNTGGVVLTPQEIRSCMYHGAFQRFLDDLNGSAAWRSVFGPVHSRMRDQELILRFIAFYYRAAQYRSPMRDFLNRYMAEHRRMNQDTQEQIRRVFARTIDAVDRWLGGNSAFRPQRNLQAAVLDAVMVGLARRLDTGQITDQRTLRRRYDDLLANAEFRRYTATGTAQEVSVDQRIRLATEAFADVR